MRRTPETAPQRLGDRRADIGPAGAGAVLTIIGGIVLGLLALIFGLLGRGRAKRGEATNGDLSVTGIVLGIIGLLIAIGIVVFGVSILNSPAG